MSTEPYIQVEMNNEKNYYGNYESTQFMESGT
jgi:hypothetical protein